MLDLGGGSAAYSIAFAKANAELQVDVVDQPTVLPLTEEYIRRAGLEERIHTRAGDLRKDRFGDSETGEGYDLVLLSAIAHMFSPEENRDLLRRIYRALDAGGRLVLQDFILEADKTRPMFAALFSLNMLVNTEGGASYSEAEYEEWLHEAGFRETRRVRLPGPANLMIATK
jgi:cyclopropane fatty-acyl-phospholipid synthase-like methyltransferase